MNRITPEECPRFNICSANLCPFDLGLSERIWYPEEAICTKQGMLKEYPWIKSQRKIARRCKDPDKYFTIEMLKKLSQVRKGTVGLSPDVEEAPQIRSWLNRHPMREPRRFPKKKYTEQERKEIGQRLREARESKLKVKG